MTGSWYGRLGSMAESRLASQFLHGGVVVSEDQWRRWSVVRDDSW